MKTFTRNGTISVNFGDLEIFFFIKQFEVKKKTCQKGEAY